MVANILMLWIMHHAIHRTERGVTAQVEEIDSDIEFAWSLRTTMKPPTDLGLRRRSWLEIAREICL